MKMDIEKKRKKEQRVVEEMIRLYCRKNHAEYDRRTGRMCPACRELSGYAALRSEKCPFMEKKTFCSSCDFPGRECCCIIPFLPSGMWSAA